MNNSENAALYYEAGDTAVAMAALTDSGDHINFTSGASLWSGRSSHAPVIRPNGLLTGGVVIPAVAAGNNNVDVVALSCNLNGVVTSVGADTDMAITRPATAVAKINSITVNAAGSIAVVAGTDGATTAFSDTRGAAGGPPLIPVDSIEIAQVRVTSNTAAVIAADQIFQVVGSHVEYANDGLPEAVYDGGKVKFLSALPLIHTGVVAKKVFASYATPTFAKQPHANDFVPPENSHSTSSQQVFGATLGTTSTSLGQGGFTAFLQDGITDNLITMKDETLWFKFYPDDDQTPYHLCQGKLGIGRAFKAGQRNQANCTISAAAVGREVSA